MKTVHNCKHYSWTIIQGTPPNNSFVRIGVSNKRGERKGDGKYPNSIFWYGGGFFVHRGDIWPEDAVVKPENLLNCELLARHDFTHGFRPLWLEYSASREKYELSIGRPVCRKSRAAILQERTRNS